MKRERRFTSKELRVQTSDTGEKSIGGYAIVYNSLSEDMGFREMVAPGAFKDFLAKSPDVRCLFNHDDNAILGRTTSGTLTLTDDQHGMSFRCVLPNTTSGNDLAVSIERGDVDQCSFGFSCVEDSWSKEANYMLRTVKAAKLYDVSPVVFPAYTSTSVSMRSLFPDGDIEIPKELRDDSEEEKGDCACGCPSCVSGSCDGCSDPDCDDDACTCQEERNNKAIAAVIERRLRS